MGKHIMGWSGRCLEFGEKPLIMGIVNITPDSFSDGGVFFDPEAAIAHGITLAAQGADILDIGGESTRPFAETVTVAEELRRVIPVIEALVKRVSIPISIDTTKSEVARRALEAGAAIVNDISAFRMDEKLADIVRDYGVPVIIMHMLGTPKTMQIAPAYKNLIEEIRVFLENAIKYAEKKGIGRDRIIIDPGIGFGKTPIHNLQLIKHVDKLKSIGCPILIGPSRKAFIRHLLKEPGGTDLSPDAPIVETGTQAVIAIAALNGADILRVHNVAGTRATLKLITAIQTASLNLEA
ncbi:MAG: dihydropteroate synthase [Pseudomonadota bacterium]